jgi:hypothetical protein
MMQSDRYTKVGIQRELHVEWFDQAARLHLTGFKSGAARKEIGDYLVGAPGFDTPPSQQTKTYVANALIKSWIFPEKDLIPLRNTAATIFQQNSSLRLTLHWCLLGAAYPFWFGVAAVVGRLLNLQDQVTQTQIVTRLKETYGDRQTISRRARYVIRSFVAWGVLKDTTTTGCYERADPVLITDPDLAILMLESGLLAIPEGKCTIMLLLNSPSFFPFQLPMITGDFVSRQCNRIEVVRYGMDDELLKLVDI